MRNHAGKTERDFAEIFTGTGAVIGLAAGILCSQYNPFAVFGCVLAGTGLGTMISALFANR